MHQHPYIWKILLDDILEFHLPSYMLLWQSWRHRLDLFSALLFLFLMTCALWLLTDYKTVALLRKLDRTIFPATQPTSLHVATADIPFTTCPCNPSFLLSDNTGYWQEHFNCLPLCLCGNQMNQLCSSVPGCCSSQNSLVCDYCNSLLSINLSDCPLYLLSRLHKVHNSAAILVFKACKWSGATSSLVTCQSQNRLQILKPE